MRPIHFRTMSVGVLAFLTFIGGAAAQQPTRELLSAPQVRELMASQQPADHAKLRAQATVNSRPSCFVAPSSLPGCC